jgi:predicted metal-binding protein
MEFPLVGEKGSASPEETEPGRGGAEDLMRKALQAGAQKASLIPVRSVVVASWVAWKCRYGCKDFGRSHTCPPHSPSYKDTSLFLQEFRSALLVQADQSFRVRYLVYLLEREAFLNGFYKAFGMGAGPCRLCDTCDVQFPCRRPEEARPSMEACGIDVYRTVRENGYAVEPLRDSGGPQHSYGLVLLE